MAYSEPKRGNNTLMWVLLGGGAACLILCGLGGFGLFQFGSRAMEQVGPLIACQIDIQAARNSILDYAAANNGKMPSARSWQDDIKPFYAKRHEEAAKEMKDAPSMLKIKFTSIDGVLGCQLASGKIQAFKFNEAFSGKQLTEDLKLSQEFVLFESPASTRNAFGKYSSPPATPEMSIMNEKRDWIRIRLSGDPDEATFGNTRVDTSPN